MTTIDNLRIAIRQAVTILNTVQDRDAWEANEILRKALANFVADQSMPEAERAWLVERQVPGCGPQWWGFNHEPSLHTDWCQDSNKAIRFARFEDADRKRLLLIEAAGFKGRPEYESQFSVTEHEWL